MMKRTLAAVCVFSVNTLVYQTAFAQTPSYPATSTATATTETATTAPDNTKRNKFEPRETTADAQKNNAADLNIAKRIRKSVMADKSLSTYAHNVKIVAVDCKVTLNGVVRSDKEKNVIEMKAAQVVGKNLVVNDLKISTPDAG